MSVGRKRAVPSALCRFARTRAITAAGMHTAILTLAAVLTFTPVATAADTLATLIQSGDRDAALGMIESGTDVNAPQGDGTTPLHWAAYRNDVELSRILLDHGAQPDALNRFGSTPLAEAIKIANLDLVEMLLDAGAGAESPNEDGQTVLMLAARSGSVEIAELLLRHGADVNARETWREQTALMWAADSNSPAMTKLLIDHGADVETRARANDWPAQFTTEPRHQNRPTGGLTPLLYAARAGCRDCAAALLEAGADPDRPNPDGNSGRFSEEIITTGATPVLRAAASQDYEALRLLVDYGGRVDVPNAMGVTPLDAALGRAGSRDDRPSEEVAPVLERALNGGG